jgi:hypothetical protein
MKKLFFVWLLFCAGLLAGCALDRRITQPTQLPQERCDLPIWDVGDYWRYQTEEGKWFAWKVVDVTDRLYVLESAANKDYRFAFDRRTLGFKEYIGSEGRKVVPFRDSGLFFDFPLFVGKKWDRMITGETDRHFDWNYLMSYRVISLEEVKVPAGTFKAFRIEQQMKDATIGGEVISYYWFSPEVKNILRFKFVRSYGSWIIKSQDYELTSYKIGKPDDQKIRNKD